MPAPYSVKAVANYFLEKHDPIASGNITQMKLHKLIYFAHGIHLGVTQYPLVASYIQAWHYGPVFPELYQEFKRFGSDPITELATDLDFIAMDYDITPRIDSSDLQTTEILDWVWQHYGRFTAGQLSTLTHEEGSPWKAVRDEHGHNRYKIISDEIIRQHFRTKLNRE